MNHNYSKLTKEELIMVLDNCSANIFVTDGTGNIVYVNKNAAEVLCSSEDYLLSQNVKNLVQNGVTSRSTTLSSLETKEVTVGSFINKSGEEILATTTPVLEDDRVIMAVTHSRRKTEFDSFIHEIERERERTIKYRDAVEFFDTTKKNKNVIIYRSNVMDELCKSARIIAPTDSTVMLYGESGVGKEVFANYIHNNSTRRNEIFVPINCAAIPRELLESELFGYEKGAFTGATSKGKVGLFEIADKGTIFLDEIGELPIDMQSKLLRVIESGEVRRIGSDRIIKTDVRIIGATNRNLLDMVKEKTFRDDLYYRLNVLPLQIPALRDRTVDIIELTEFFLKKTNKKYAKHATIDAKQMEELCKYSWPGNVRELRNIIERYVITGSEQVISNLKSEYDRGNDEKSSDTIANSICQNVTENFKPLKERMSEIELEYIKRALEANENNVQKTAELLGVNRSLIYRKLSEKR